LVKNGCLNLGNKTLLATQVPLNTSHSVESLLQRIANGSFITTSSSNQDWIRE